MLIQLILIIFLIFSFSNTSYSASVIFPAPISVQEEDGSPVGNSVSKIKVSNSALTINADGSASINVGTSTGDITAVGPACLSGACFSDGTATSGTTMLIWEGTTADGNELSIISPTADPATDINITLPSETGTLLYEILAVADIQTAIDVAEAAGGGIVHLGCGTYTLTSGLTIESSNVILEGSGHCTILTPGNSTNIDVITVSNVGLMQHWGIKNLMINGNKANQASGRGIYLNLTRGSQFDTYAHIDGVYIYKTKGNGIEENNSNYPDELWITNTYVEETDGIGVLLYWNDHKIEKLISGNNVANGIKNYGGNDQFTNCKAYGNDFTAIAGGPTYSNWAVNGARSQLINCQVQDGKASGFYVGADDVILVGCQADDNNNGGTVTGTFYGFEVGAAADRTVITGCTAFGTNQDYGLGIVDGATGTIISGNNFESNATGAINASATAMAANYIDYRVFSSARGITYWGDCDSASYDTGNEICNAQKMTCLNSWAVTDSTGVWSAVIACNTDSCAAGQTLQAICY